MDERRETGQASSDPMLSAEGGFPEPGAVAPTSAYWAFYRAVAARQLAAWLPEHPVRLLDLSGRAEAAHQAARAGHDVVHVVPEQAAASAGAEPPDRVREVVAETSRLPFLADAAVDAVIAERLSFSLATEVTVADLVRVLRPGGQLLLRVDSLLAGMASLAEQQCWAMLSDAPSAEVLLVPSPDGTITRCFWPEQLRELLGEAGFDVDWVRPRTVLSPPVVHRALAHDPSLFETLVETELSLPQDLADESVGFHLLASARRPPAAA